MFIAACKEIETVTGQKWTQTDVDERNCASKRVIIQYTEKRDGKTNEEHDAQQIETMSRNKKQGKMGTGDSKYVTQEQ